MINIIKNILSTTLLLLLVGSCDTGTSSESTNGFQISGTAEGYRGDSLYLYEVTNELQGFLAPITAMAVDARGSFTYANDSLLSRVYYISTDAEAARKSLSTNGKSLFLQKGDNKVLCSITPKGELKAMVEDNLIDAQFQAYKAKEYKLGNQAILDSISSAFYIAREAGDRTEMDRLNTESAPFFEEGRARKQAWVDSLLTNNQYQLFDLYLFYNKVFTSTSYNSIEEINAVRLEIEQYNEEAKESGYYALLQDQLSWLEKSAIGAEAPEVLGESVEGEPLKLSDFRGQYVLLDFWSSGCSWCRAESPNLIKTYETFHDKGFTILGASSDFKKESWIRAIEEDGAKWDHLIIGRDERQSIFQSYSITGIPLILLISPEGKILAKELRGDDIYNTVAHYLSE